MTQSVVNRLGILPFGTEAPRIGNFLLYPRRVVLEVLALAFQQEDLFVPLDAPGTVTERNPYLLRYDAEGRVLRDSRIVLTDFGSEHPSKGENRPRITVDRGTSRFAHNTGFGQREHAAWGSRSSTHADLIESSIDVRCVARVRTESESLAVIVATFLMFFRDEIKRKSNLFHLGSPIIAPTTPEKADAEVEQAVTTVTIATTQALRWTKTQINETRLNEICVALQEQGEA